MAERITITIEPSDEKGGFLTVQDAMRQVLDFIDVVVAAASDDARSKFSWRLISATTNSPFTTVAEAVPEDPEWPDVELEAKHAKVRVTEAFQEILTEGRVPDWVGKDGQKRIESLLGRNMNGIAKTTIRITEGIAPVVVYERNARATLDKIERALRAETVDYSGEELGSIEGQVLDVTTHYGKPALRVRSRLSDDKVLCVFDERAADIGEHHNWQEVWRGKRVILTGKLKRAPNGAVTFMTVEEVKSVEHSDAEPADFLDPTFTNGREVREYLDEIWNGKRGGED
jgi:hypothetical protein